MKVMLDGPKDVELVKKKLEDNGRLTVSELEQLTGDTYGWSAELMEDVKIVWTGKFYIANFPGVEKC